MCIVQKLGQVTKINAMSNIISLLILYFLLLVWLFVMLRLLRDEATSPKRFALIASTGLVIIKVTYILIANNSQSAMTIIIVALFTFLTSFPISYWIFPRLKIKSKEKS